VPVLLRAEARHRDLRLHAQSSRSVAADLAEAFGAGEGRAARLAEAGADGDRRILVVPAVLFRVRLVLHLVDPGERLLLVGPIEVALGGAEDVAGDRADEVLIDVDQRAAALRLDEADALLAAALLHPALGKVNVEDLLGAVVILKLGDGRQLVLAALH